MKNLKKALVLVLAFAMVFSLFTFNASAASFADDEDIVNKEAVSTMSQLGVINGYEDGTFLPNQVVTRAEMCKMISVAMNGGTAPIVDSSTVMFSDTKGHWANGYISYCYNKGVVSGDAGKGGTFRPDAPVTGTEAAKMILIALGYNSSVAGFTGADWANNVSSAANDRGLFSGLGNLNVTAGLSRDNAAQMIYNGINAEMVTYNNILGTDANGQITSTPTISVLSGKTILTEKYKVIKVEGVVVGNEVVTGSSLKGKTTIYLNNTPGIEQYGAGSSPKTARAVTFKVSTTADMLGKTITLFVKPATSAPNDSVQATVIGSPVVSSRNTVYATSKTLVNDPAKSNDITKTLSAAGLKFDSSVDVLPYVNYEAGAVNSGTAAAKKAAFVNSAGVDAQYIDNDGDGIIDVVTKLSYSFGKVTTATTASNGTLYVTLLGSYGSSLTSTKANEEVVNFADLGLAVNDYVRYYTVASKYYVEKMTGVTVDVTATTGTVSVTASGKTYTKSSLASSTDMSAAIGDQPTIDTAVSLNKSAVFYLDNGGYVMYVDSVTTTEKYLMLTTVAEDTGTYKDTVSAKALFEDGTVKAITISKVGTTTINGSTANDQRIALANTEIVDGDNAVIYTYTVDSNGKYQITAQATAKKASTNITNSTPTISASDDRIIATTSTPIVTANTALDSFTVYTGISTVTSMTGVYAYAVLGDNNVAKIVFAYGGTGTTSNDNYMFVYNKTATKTLDSNGAEVFTYKVIRGGEITTIVGTAGTGIFPNVGLYVVTLVGTKADSATMTPDSRMVAAAEAVSASNGVVGNANGSYLYNSNTKVFIIENNTATETTIDAIVTSGAKKDRISMIIGSGSSAGIAQYVFIERDVVYASAPTAITVTEGGSGGTTVDDTADDFIGDSLTTIAATAAAAGDTLTIAVTPAASTTYTIAITSSAASNAGSMTGGNNANAVWTLDSGDIGATLTVTVTCSQSGYTDLVRTYSITVTNP